MWRRNEDDEEDDAVVSAGGNAVDDDDAQQRPMTMTMAILQMPSLDMAAAAMMIISISFLPSIDDAQEDCRRCRWEVAVCCGIIRVKKWVGWGSVRPRQNLVPALTRPQLSNNIQHDDDANIVPIKDKFHRVQLTPSHGESSINFFYCWRGSVERVQRQR